MYLPSYLELFTVDLLHDRVSLGTFPCFILDIMVALKCRSMKSRYPKNIYTCVQIFNMKSDSSEHIHLAHIEKKKQISRASNL